MRVAGEHLLADVASKLDSPKPDNKPPDPYPPNACNLAGQPQPTFGAPYMGPFLDGFPQTLAQSAQSSYLPETAGGIAWTALKVIESQAAAASTSFSELWLAEAARVMFMSYYVPLPDPKVPDHKAKAQSGSLTSWRFLVGYPFALSSHLLPRESKTNLVLSFHRRASALGKLRFHGLP